MSAVVVAMGRSIDLGGEGEKVLLTIHYRTDRDEIERDYMDNAAAIRTIDSLLVLPSSDYIDTMRIIAFASPEGNPDYNLRLSQRRAESLKQYILERHPKFRSPTKAIIAEGLGINWAGFREMVVADAYLPLKHEIIAILDNPQFTQAQKQRYVEGLDSGRIYRNYIFPRYYHKLRSGASLFVIYDESMPEDIDSNQTKDCVTEPEPELQPETEPELQPEPEPEPLVIMEEPITREPVRKYVRPFALKTNLLFDLATLFNIELEIPIGKHFSLLGEWTFPWWGGLGNRGGVSPTPFYSEKYTLQVLSAGLELRYWFAPREGEPLTGWFVAPYIGRGIYDLQYNKDGYQGEFFMAAGLSGGYAHTIGKNLHMEYSLGVGYLQTDYRYYTPLDGHKVYRHSGQYSWIGPTKAKISLVWIPRFKAKQRMGGER
ncbi:hypothetical protein BN938_1631 [Mucinivorans hirudinis]|uniref:DUF3575 domain-containing protein n=1 Tax=Mucinivorans hirudinis TaxID=1433126 RepID=A0A060R8B8_9BACT|nr:hypothetical protein BN938_1631 [Mucinivorans hirudinis]